MNKTTLSVVMLSAVIASCASVPTNTSSLSALTKTVKAGLAGGKEVGSAVESNKAASESAEQLAAQGITAEDTKKMSKQELSAARASAGDLDPVIIPGKNTKGRFAKKPYPDMVGDTRKWVGVSKVSVPSYKVSFDKKSGASASASTGNFGTGPSANANIKAVLQGVDEATFERVTNKAYADFEAKLTAAGYEVVGVDVLNQTAAYQKWKADKYPKAGKGKSEYLAAGMRSTGKITAGLSWGKLMNETQAAILMPELMVNFATFGTQERDNWSSNGSATAKVSVGPSAHVNSLVSGTTLKKCDKRGQCWGDQVYIHSGQVTYSKTPFARIDNTTSTGAAVAMGAMNALASLAGTSTFSSKEMTVSADAAKYEQAVLEALLEANSRIVNKLKAADKT